MAWKMVNCMLTESFIPLRGANFVAFFSGELQIKGLFFYLSHGAFRDVRPFIIDEATRHVF